MPYLSHTDILIEVIMKTLTRLIATAALISSSPLFAATVPVYNFPAPNLPYATQYGDFASYSMPILSWASTSMLGPAYTFNTANTIQDSLVIGTGAQTNNQDLGLIGTVANGFDFPNITDDSTQNWSTTTAETGRSTWNISLSALQDYLTFDGVQHDMVAYFNNNQTAKQSAIRVRPRF